MKAQQYIYLIYFKKCLIQIKGLDRISCSQVEKLNSHNIKSAILDCGETDEPELKKFIENGGNALIFLNTEKNLIFADHFEVSVHQSNQELKGLQANKAVLTRIPEISSTPDVYLTYDNQNIVLFPVLSAKSDFFLSGEKFSSKSYLLGAILRNGKSKVILSAFKAGELDKATYQSILAWLNAPCELKLGDIKIMSKHDRQLIIGGDNSNLRQDNLIKSVEIRLDIPKEFHHSKQLESIDANIALHSALTVHFNDYIRGVLSKDRNQIVFRVDKNIHLHWKSRLTFHLREPAVVNTFIAKPIDTNKQDDDAPTPFNMELINIYACYSFLFAGMLLFVHIWLSLQTLHQ